MVVVAEKTKDPSTKAELKPIKLGEHELSSYVYIPPMSGYTDYSYRRLCQEYDPDILMATEMLSSKAMMFEKETKRMFIGEHETLTGVQLFGHEPDVMEKAARKAEDSGALFIDINMGCPVPKLTKSMDGAGLMKSPDLALEIVKSVKKATKLPVTVKTRLGWDYESLNAAELARSFEAEGVEFMTIHGRTRSQKYTGNARWDLIKEVVDAVNIPIFANGDINTLEDVEKILEVTGAAGVAIARGTMGRPWFAQQANHYIKTGGKLPDPGYDVRCELALKHFQYLVELKGQKIGSKESRKHIVHYTKGMQGSSKLRARLSQIDSYEEAKEALEELKAINGL